MPKKVIMNNLKFQFIKRNELYDYSLLKIVDDIRHTNKFKYFMSRTAHVLKFFETKEEEQSYHDKNINK